jgi:carbonic anhydrase
MQKLLIEINKIWMTKKDGSSHVNGSLKTVVLSCIDSRVPVEKIFQAKPGELLVLKNAGNLLTDDMFRSALVATFELGAKFFVILGHTRCGMAIKNNSDKMTHLSEKIGDVSLKKIEKYAHQGVSDWFGFFNQNEWKLNIEEQAIKLKNLLNAITPEEKHPIILKALYDLDSGEIKFI